MLPCSRARRAPRADSGHSIALEPGKTGCGQLQEDTLKLGGIKAERKRMGKHGTAPEPFAARTVAASRRAFGMYPGAPFASQRSNAT